MFRLIMLKQSNSSTSIETFSGPYVTHHTALREVPGSIPGSEKDFDVCFVVVVLLLCCP